MDLLLAAIEHPIMAAVHPWLVGTAFTLLAVALVVAIWGWLSDEDVALYSLVGTLVGSAVVGVTARVLNPYLGSDERFSAGCGLAMLLLGLCALWEYVCGWGFRPFRYLVWLPPVLELGRMTMTIPAHLKTGAEQIVTLLNQVPDPVKNALVIGAVLLTFLAACIKFVKSLTA